MTDTTIDSIDTLKEQLQTYQKEMQELKDKFNDPLTPKHERLKLTPVIADQFTKINLTHHKLIRLSDIK
jgi:hypothetical protein